MNYSFSIEGFGYKTDKLSSSQGAIERIKQHKDKGLTSLIKGQLITGTVVSSGEQVTLDFDGEKVSVSKNVVGNAKPGEEKIFEVIKITSKEIELRLQGGRSESKRPSFKASLVKDSDWESILTQKELSAKKAGNQSEYKEIKDKLEEVGSKLTELDCQVLEKEGFLTENFTIDGLYRAVNRVKADISSDNGNDKYTDKTTSIHIRQDTNATKTKSEKRIINKLKEENLPIIPENVAKVVKALELCESISGTEDKAMQYLISNEAEPTPENIYKASFSSIKQTTEKLSEKAWNDLQVQVATLIKEAGYEINQENLETAKWVIESKMPLTVETFSYKKELDKLKADADTERLLDRMVEGMKQGINPKDVSLIEQKEVSYDKLIQDIHSIRPDTLTEAIKNKTELTIKKLVQMQGFGAETKQVITQDMELLKNETGSNEDFETNQSDPDASIDNVSYEDVRAKRQLEEIRLKMTIEAASQIEKNGIRIETQKLEKVVEALRDLENRYYKERLKEVDAEATDAQVQILKETTQSIERLKYIPNYVLGSTLRERNTQTISGLLSEGVKIQSELMKAGIAYETMMTVPNGEYGDSIRKAFANADSVLAELNLENTQANQRAVRILGYNQMQISEASIHQVKAYDLQVSSLMKNLHPAVTVRMIKEGLNPLEMSISELNQTIDRIKEEQGINSEEKYSTYLRKLEKTEGITEEERKAYIGIYRLLYNVEKSDGAALGAVIKAGREVSLEHLLTAIQTGKKGHLDTAINDEFGTLQSITRGKDSLTEQLQSFKRNPEKGQDSKENTEKDQAEYMNRMVKQLTEEISPEKLKAAGENNTLSATQPQVTQSNTIAASDTTASSTKGIWESIKHMTVEKLYEQLQNSDSSVAAEDEHYIAKIQEIRELCKNSEQSIRFLNDYRVPSTPLNILMANHVLSNGESPIKKLLKLQKENIVEKSENSLKELNDLSDTLNDKHSMEEVYTKLEMDAKAALNQSYSEEKIDSRKLTELKSLGQQIKFLKILSEKEYYQIPIETDAGITNINLTILRGSQTSGKVSVAIWSERLGNVKAEFLLKDNNLKGFISSDNRNGLEQLQRSAGEIQTAAEEAAVNLKQIDFVIQSRDNDSYTYQNPIQEEGIRTGNAQTERILYRVAKAVVQTVRLAEGGSSDKEQAVS